jgi:hypothetical protein
MALPLAPLDWRTFAVCRDLDPEIFFPVGDPGDPFDPRNAPALAACARCPVRAECLTDALARVEFGVMGGMTAEQRDTLRRYRRRTRPAEVTVSPSAGQLDCDDRTPPPVRSPLVLGPGTTAPRATARARGVELLVEGRTRRQEIARLCRVSERTVDRWAVRPEVAPLLAELAARREAEQSQRITRREARAIGARAVS